jgi:ribosomal protein S18 acetylase RimI-like enzyme
MRQAGRVEDYSDHSPRPVRSTDAGAVAAMWLRARRAAVPAIPTPVHDDDEVYEWFATVIIPERETWVIEHAKRIVALLVLEPGRIDQLYVDPEFTGRGLGSRLLDVAKQTNPRGLDLWTFETNTGARRFYERHGFVVVGATDGDNEEGAPDIRYRW